MGQLANRVVRILVMIYGFIRMAFAAEVSAPSGWPVLPLTQAFVLTLAFALDPTLPCDSLSGQFTVWFADVPSATRWRGWEQDTSSAG